MKLTIEEILDKDIKEFLLNQKGILEVNMDIKDFITTLFIKYDDNVTLDIIIKYIELYTEKDLIPIIEFNKDINIKTNKYIIESEICCDCCYKNFIIDMMDNEDIISVSSNYKDIKDLKVKFEVEYNKDSNEENLKKYIIDKLEIYK